MANTIKMTPEQMRGRAKQFTAEGAKVDSTIKKMQGLINTLKSEWEGKAATEFENQFNSLKPSFQDMKQLIDDIAKQLQGTADAVEKMDQEIASKFKV